MQLTSQITEHFRSVHTGNNWTAVNLKDFVEYCILVIRY